MDAVAERLVSRRGRWPKSWDNPAEPEIRRGLERVTLLLRKGGPEGKLFAINKQELDIYETDIANFADTSHTPGEVSGLKVASLWYGSVPIGNHWAGDIHVTVEDVIANLGEFTPDSLVEVWIWGAKIGEHEKLGRVWHPIFITYLKEK